MKLEAQTIEKINETNSWFFQKMNKIYKPLTRLTNKKGEKTHISGTKQGIALQTLQTWQR